MRGDEYPDAMRKPDLVRLAFKLGLGRSRAALDVRHRGELLNMIKAAQAANATTKEN
jgi:hypothetical protein